METLRKLLGVTQEELALLLKVTRSQLSMYELGKRDLPLAAKKQLTEMLQHVKETTLAEKVTNGLMKEDVLLKKAIVVELLQNTIYQQIKVERALKKYEKKYTTGQATVNLIGFLEKQTAKKKKETDSLLESMKTKSLKVVGKSNLAVLTKLQIQKEVLAAEKKVIERFLQNL
ncbi:helix-turn-helix domain-containing protein [Flavobacterium sp.]|uniref:helix-turn-helix domain-containing protein n=1 Tax=Flavobacterium sp. TaxID=239 RepID=UPI002622540E|nr:helix-turn-helix transcriptional regulator [Flavobacterium sp.]